MCKRFFTALFVEFSLQTTELMALQTYRLVDQQKTEIPISRNQQNRIAVTGDRIQQIFGADGAFDVQSDDETGQIFVKCLNTTEKEPFTLTIIMESGLTHDLRLLPQAIEFQSIVFKPAVAPSVRPAHASPSQKQRLARLMKAMAQASKADGYTLTSLQNAGRLYPEPLKVLPKYAYRGDSDQGEVYVLRNEGEMPVILKEEDFFLPGDLALSLSKNTLQPDEEAHLLVIIQRTP